MTKSKKKASNPTKKPNSKAVPKSVAKTAKSTNSGVAASKTVKAQTSKGASASSSSRSKKTPSIGNLAAGALAQIKGASKSAMPMVEAVSAADTVCREVACENLATTSGYCRLHYIKNWKKIKRKETIIKEGKLNQYIEELVAKYPDKYLEAIRQDLANDKEFAKVITDLDLDEGIDDFESDSEGVDSIIDNIKRDFDDEGNTF